MASTANYPTFILLSLCVVSVSLSAESIQPVTVDTAFSTSSPQSDTNYNKTATIVASALGAEILKTPKNIEEAKLSELTGDERNLRLLEIRIGKYQIDDLLSTYQHEDMLFIPLGFFSELIDLAINTDPAKGIAQGFIFKESRQFYLDVHRGEVTVSGKLKKFDKQRAAIREFDDIYIDSNLINEWLLLKIEIDLYSSRLKIKSDELLPLQLRKQREDRIKIARARQIPLDRGYPLQIEPYQDWNYPLVNHTSTAGIFRHDKDNFDSTYTHSTYATADLMHMESSWYLAGNQDDFFDDFRVTFGKRDPGGSLLGKLQATEYEIGYIQEPRLDFITRSQDAQVGAFVSNYPLTRQLQFDAHTFRGDLPPGWEVELYRNNSLLDYQSAAAEGQYQFENVPLLFGSNYFRLVFYGPQGQQREETYTFNLDDSLTQPDQQYYRAHVSGDEDFGTRTILQYDLGIRKDLSLAATFASIPIDKLLLIDDNEGNHNYLDVGIRGFWRSVFYRTDVTKDLQSGSVVDWEIQTRLGEVILNIGESYFQDTFVSEQFQETSIPLVRRSSIKIDTAIPAASFLRIPVSFDLERDLYEDGITFSRFANRISANRHGFAISNTLNVNSQTGLDTQTSGNLQLSHRAFGYNFRGSASYNVSPDSELSAAVFTLDGFKLWKYHISTGVSRVFENKVDEIFYSMIKSHGAYSLGINSRYSTGGRFGLNVSFTIGLGREPRSGTWRPEYRPIANQGSMSVQAYLDKNINGIKEPEEESLQGIKVRVNGGNIQQPSDEQGIVFVTGLEPYRGLDIDIAAETLDDPLWLPAVKGKRVFLRPGHVTQVDFPILITGEIDGTAYVQLENRKQEVSGVVIELLDLNGKLIKSTKTAYDGFYLLNQIPIGKYQLRVSREQTDSLNLLRVEPTFVIIETNNPIVNGMDFVLQKRGEIPPSE